MPDELKDLKHLAGLMDDTSPARLMQQGKSRGKGPAIPAFRPTDEQRHTVMVLAANRVKRQVMAEVLRINIATLDKYFKGDIRIGKDATVARVGIAVVRQALAGNMTAAKYWLDRHGGPAWQLPKGVEDSTLPNGDGILPDEVVHFFLPPNGRDQPEPEPEAPTIEGEAEEKAA